MTTNKRISIPIIPYGLRQEETIVQIATVLDNIDSLVTNIFQEIERNIHKHREYLISLQKRGKIISAKVDKLAGQNVATTVYSHYKFPSEEPSFNTLFQLNLEPVEKKPNVTIQSKFQHAKYNKSLNKLHFFHVKADNDFIEKELIFQQGIGSIPADVNSVTSLLLFNTSENLYQKYVMIDPLAVVNNSRITIEEEKQKSDIAAAPTSILTDYVFQNKDYFKGFYTPAYEEVPSINVPVDLPDLPGIAGDLKFNYKIQNPTAPSKQPQECQKLKTVEEISVDDLPVIPQFNISNSETSDIQVTSVVNAPTVLPSVPDSVSYIPSIPAPPPLPSEPLPFVPPPPPPMPELEISKTANLDNSEDTHNVPQSSSNVNAHATLMEELRNVDLGRLRPVTERREHSPGLKMKESAREIFTREFYNKLGSRRIGISGQKKGTIMDSVSGLIPCSTDTSNDSGDDNESNPDWED